MAVEFSQLVAAGTPFVRLTCLPNGWVDIATLAGDASTAELDDGFVAASIAPNSDIDGALLVGPTIGPSGLAVGKGTLRNGGIVALGAPLLYPVLAQGRSGKIQLAANIGNVFLNNTVASNRNFVTTTIQNYFVIVGPAGQLAQAPILAVDLWLQRPPDALTHMRRNIYYGATTLALGAASGNVVARTPYWGRSHYSLQIEASGLTTDLTITVVGRRFRWPPTTMAVDSDTTLATLTITAPSGDITFNMDDRRFDAIEVLAAGTINDTASYYIEASD